MDSREIRRIVNSNSQISRIINSNNTIWEKPFEGIKWKFEKEEKMTMNESLYSGWYSSYELNDEKVTLKNPIQKVIAADMFEYMGRRKFYWYKFKTSSWNGAIYCHFEVYSTISVEVIK
ncbi:hypothetical protein [Peptoniphilus duerdenii]|uniref:hypothetical protein n=1 Tax=Peptoniphilus duerdenii TaxID=507750 RepID=UPI00288A136F|nr:hypothetical protein [Peptoniphilus duerdenii]